MLKAIEVVAIGEELLKGTIANTNGAEISRALFEAGYICHRHSVLQDNKTTLIEGLRESLARSSVVITTGGLGPTTDDITRQCAAVLFDSTFSYNKEIAEDLKKRYGNLQVSLKDQATIPTKAGIIKNPLGTASGLIFHINDQTLILLPGVPHEMRAMLKNDVLPYLKKHFPLDENISTASAHFFMLSESAVDPVIRNIQQEIKGISFGIYPAQGTLSVYAVTQSKNGEALVKNAIDRLIEQFKDHHFKSASGKIEEAVQELFIKNGWTLSVAESCTGGAISSKLTKIPGASKYFRSGIVSYSNDLKTTLLNVPEEIIEAHGAVSSEVATAMVTGCLKATKSTFAISTTGIAGPGGETVGKPVGTIWIAVGRQGQTPYSKIFKLRGDRPMNIEHSVNAALSELLLYISH